MKSPSELHDDYVNRIEHAYVAYKHYAASIPVMFGNGRSVTVGKVHFERYD